MPLTISTHPSAPVTRVKDLMLEVPGAGGSVVLEDLDALRDASESCDLSELATNEAFGPGLSTLVIDLGDGAIPLADVARCLKGAAEALEEGGVRDIERLLVTTDGGLIYNNAGQLLLREGR